ncbi:MAG TPA: hypothetical protein VKZ18_21435 [Polyangia bacterium]|nr:hypothetical protein [Polyangia bacterium]
MFGTSGASQVLPLHRLAALNDDPARAWLSTGEAARIDFTGWLLWAVFVVAMYLLRWVARVVIFLYVTPFFSGRISWFVVGGLFVLMRPGIRRSILRVKSARIEKLLARDADSIAADDWTALAGEPDGKIVSVVGWARGRLHLEKPLGGDSAIGVALPCQDTFPGVFESVHDFELVDEEGRSIPIQVAGGRIFGRPNVALDSHQLRHLCSDLGVPSGATPSGWQVYALRDGDPVMVVGFKQSFIDPMESSLRGPTPRAALGSAPPRPLLVFSIPAERRQV